jgi:hypothetical protein
VQTAEKRSVFMASDSGASGDAGPAGGDGTALASDNGIPSEAAAAPTSDGEGPAATAVADPPHVDLYEGHVALALETHAVPAFDAALDLLTTSHQLFDVPAIDFSTSMDDASAV